MTGPEKSEFRRLIAELDGADIAMLTWLVVAMRDGRPGRAVRAAADLRRRSGQPPMTTKERRDLWRMVRAQRA